MSRVFCIPGIFLLFCAFVLSFLASISLPFLTVFDVARVHFGEQAAASGGSGITQLRVSALYSENDKNVNFLFSPLISSVYGTMIIFLNASVN